MQLQTKEAADWLWEPSNEAAFIKELGTEAHIKGRVYPILIPRVPLSFDPENEENLWEVESTNDLPPKTISKVWWIKPAYWRHPRQQYAYVTFSLSTAAEANRLIRDGMFICSRRAFSQRLKYEPRQCMKCHKWGHYANDCQATINTCRTCGGDHMTRDCKTIGKRYCISCHTEDHASWDRTCPEFLRKSAHFNELHLENALTYFLTAETWTQRARPDRILLENRFPAKSAGGIPCNQQKARSRTAQGAMSKHTETQPEMPQSHSDKECSIDDQASREEDLESEELNQPVTRTD